jgi:hypothetical protein
MRPTTAEKLEGQGRLLEAIDLLSAANRERRDPELEVRLVRLRRDALGQVQRPAGRRRWPPRVRDRFRDVDGIPDIPATQLAPKLVRSAIFHHGGLLVRGLISPARVEQLVGDIDRAFAAYDAQASGAADAALTQWFRPFEPLEPAFVPRPWLREGGAVLAVDSPPALFDVIEAFEEVGIGRLVTGFLGQRPILLGQKCTLRRASTTEHFADWHQDGSFMGAHIRSLDLWTALSHCGVDAPGLDIVPERIDHIIDTGTGDATYDWGVAGSLVEAASQTEIVRPVFEPGDAILFDHFLVHRTAVDPEMTRDRYAIEAWFAAASHYPTDQLPIAY